MPENLSGWLLTAIAVVTFLASAAVFLRGSADKGTITSLLSSVEALKIENDTKDTKIAEQSTRIAEQSTRIESLEAQVRVLSDVVTNKSEVERLLAVAVSVQGTLDTHHADSMRVLAQIRESMK